MKVIIRLGMSVVAVVMLGEAGIMELNAQVFAQPLQPESQPARLWVFRASTSVVTEMGEIGYSRLK